MQVRFNKRDLPKHGVQIITSADPAFEATAADYFKDSGDTLESLKPFSVFIKNSGNRTVVGYVLVWQLVKTNGQVLTNVNSYSEPGILMGDPVPSHPAFKHTQAIKANAVRGFSWSAPIGRKGEGRLGASNDSRPEQSQNSREADSKTQLISDLAEATDLTVSVDGVFFDDGTFVGPNSTGFFERMQAIVSAKLDLLSEVAIAREQGKIDQAFENIAANSLSPAVTVGPNSSPADYYKYYRQLFAREINDQQGAYGKETLAAYLAASHKRARPTLKKARESWSDKD